MYFIFFVFWKETAKLFLKKKKWLYYVLRYQEKISYWVTSQVEKQQRQKDIFHLLKYWFWMSKFLWIYVFYVFVTN